MSDEIERPCGDHSRATRCSGTYCTHRDWWPMYERYKGFYLRDGERHSCEGCPIYEDPIYARVADRLEGKER